MSSFLSNLTTSAPSQNPVLLPPSSSTNSSNSTNIMTTLVPVIQTSVKFVKAVVNELEKNPETREKVKQLAVAGITMIHRRNSTKLSSQTSSSNLPTLTTPPAPSLHVQTNHKESVKLDNTTYSGSTMRKLLASILVVGIGAVVTYLNKDELEQMANKFTNSISLDSVVALLTRISINTLKWAATTKDATAKKLKKWLKKTKTSVKLNINKKRRK